MARGKHTEFHTGRLVARQQMTAQRAIQVLGYGGEGAEDIRNSFSNTRNPDALEGQLYKSFYKRQRTRY